MNKAEYVDNRPREKLVIQGPQALSLIELLAILIGSGPAGSTALEVAEDLLKSVAGGLDELGRIPPEGLTVIHGIGMARAIRIAAALELGRRRQGDRGVVEGIPVIRTAADVHAIFALQLADLSHEEFWLLLLRRNNEVMAKLLISRGGLSGTVADPKIIFGKALAMRSAALVAVHNHPSGQTEPSSADRRLTGVLRDVGNLLDCPLLDHVIVARERYFSFADAGEL